MSSINDLTEAQIRGLLELYEQSQNKSNNEFDRSQLFYLPDEIMQELEESSSSELKGKLKRFSRDTLKYDGGRWTQPGVINRIFIQELKKQQLEATQAVNAFYKGADRLRTTARATTEIFSDVQHIINNKGSQDEMELVLQKIQRPAIYSFATGKELDQDAKDLAIKTIKLPENMQYLRDGEDEDKDMAFSSDIVEKIQQSRYEEAMLKSATSKSYGGFRPRGDRGRSFNRGSRRGHFCGRGRGRGSTPPTTDNHHQSNTSNQ